MTAFYGKVPLVVEMAELNLLAVTSNDAVCEILHIYDKNNVSLSEFIFPAVGVSVLSKVIHFCVFTLATP